jgi:bifunctional DNA-binding transcriptional regulator/antitoxin component of YhaV-PrlF toxin-antitoxin module
VVIPVSIRERAGFVAGAELEITLDDTGVRLQRVAAGPRLTRIGKRLVARPTARAGARPVIDVASIVEEERNRWP